MMMMTTMDSDIRPHRTPNSTTTTTSELFICFTSRLSSSSSSMKISSKSLLGQSRSSRDPPVSLSASLSRKFRTNGSLRRGQASPMFSSGSKKRSQTFENPEPSSPKVTCIGQVRIKTKKQGKKMRALKQRGGDLSFRRSEQSNSSNHQFQQERLGHRNQRWVHLPLTICEALKGFGSEFSCLFPCRSPCSSRRSERAKKGGRGSGESGSGSSSSYCGTTVCARWLVALQDGEGGRRREIELVVGGGEEEERTELRAQRSVRRHVFDEIEIRDLKCEEQFGGGGEEDEEAGEGGRVSICIPPKNALLLMRCRSDPMRMSTLVNKLCEPTTVTKEEEEEEDDDDDGGEDEDEDEEVRLGEGEVKFDLKMEDEGIDLGEKGVRVTESEKPENHDVEGGEEIEVDGDKLGLFEEVKEEEIEERFEVVTQRKVEEEEILGVDSCCEAVLEKETEEDEAKLVPEEVEEERRLSCSSSMESKISDLKVQDEAEGGELAEESSTLEAEAEKSIEKEEKATQQRSLSDTQLETLEKGEDRKPEERNGDGEVERESEVKKKVERERETPSLPDCLLLMMCEPKLSMEVSKETWVCSTDFIRALPQRPINKRKVADEPKKKIDDGDSNNNPPVQAQPQPQPQPQRQSLRQPPPSSSSVPAKSTNIDPNPAHGGAHRSTHQRPPRSSSRFPAPAANSDSNTLQPPRSSCSYPASVAGVSMAAMIEQKLVNAVGYEPFVLTRCKSAPMRSAAKVAQEPCFWKKEKLEPHRQATAGVGF